MPGSSLRDQLEQHYRWMHRHPELSYQETATTAYLARILDAAGIEILDSGLRTGLVARIQGAGGGGHVVALRGDIDALPVTEETGAEFASEHAGVMHACGHDFNATSVLGAALSLNRIRERLAGDVTIILQPAEEVRADDHTPTGALAVLSTGVLDNVDLFYGVHDSPRYHPGDFGISAGPISGHVSKFSIHITGKGSHAAEPQQGASPIRAVVAVAQSIESIGGYDVDPEHAHVVTVTQIHSGNTWNVVADTASLSGTVRTLGASDATVLRNRMRSIVDGVALSFDLRAELDWQDGSPSVDNDRDWSQFAVGAAQKRGFHVVPQRAALGGEDFSYYQQRRPGVFVHAGVGGESGAGLHNARFLPSLEGLYDTAQLLASLAEASLLRLRAATRSDGRSQETDAPARES